MGLLTIERSWERMKTGAGSPPAVEKLIATNATPQKEEVPEKEAPETAPDSPLLDLSDAAVKKLTHSAKKRGYVTHDQINSVLPSEEVNSQEIEDVLADETEVIEPDERRQRNGKDESTEPEMQNEGGEIVELKRPAPAKGKSSELSARTDDPVRMYLREMGSVELLSREGEIAIAKRIEAGREAMIAGLCESPLTFQAIIIWRDELNEGKVFLRDIIDLEATYAGPDAKAMPAPVIGPDGQPIRAARAGSRRPGADADAAGRARERHPVQAGARARQRRGRRGRRDAAGRRRFRRRRYGELALACRHRGRAQAQGGRDLRQHCRRL